MGSLPDPFVAEMQDLFERFGLSAECPSFLQSFQAPSWSGLRTNTRKIQPDSLIRLMAGQAGLPAASIRPVSWCDDGFYCPPGLQPGKLAAHAAGLYYIQEPSAMLPAQVLSVHPGERVLDLCAAPGGKAARLASDLKGQGLLWANEISHDRVRALQRNIELTGCTNAVITRETPERLAVRLTGWFDAILADVPCSGSGMFRRDPAAVRSWQAYGPDRCTPLQNRILEAAWQMLRPGGRLVYSTCSFSLAENEGMIAGFSDRHADCRILPITALPGTSNGLPLAAGLDGTIRIWPHRADGEGHFCAMLAKVEGSAMPLPLYRADPGTDEGWMAFSDFCQATLTAEGQARMRALADRRSRRAEHDHLHLMPECPEALAELSKVKTGLFLGQLHRRGRQGIRFEPSMALLLSLNGSDLKHPFAAPENSDLVRRCLRGETLTLPDAWVQAGWPAGATAAILLSGDDGSWPLSWARLMQPPLMKNLYPRGWTRQQ